MARVVSIARVPSGEIAEIRSEFYKSGQTFLKGEFLKVSTTGVEVCSTSPTIAVGIALEDAGSRPGYDIGHSPSTITGRLQEISMAVLNKVTVFSLTGNVTAAQLHIGVSYGVNVASNIWELDISDTTNKAFKVVDIDTTLDIFFCIADDAILV